MSDRARWEERHAASPRRARPSAFVAEHVTQRARAGRLGRALDLACGAGRHAALLRSVGFEVVALDQAAVACARVVAEVPGACAVVADAAALPFRPGSFQVVVQTLFLDRTIFAALLPLLAPGGLLLAETFLVGQHEATGHPRREFCLAPGELRSLLTRAGTPVRVLAEREGAVARDGRTFLLASLAVCKV